MARAEIKFGLPVMAFGSATAWEEWLGRQPRLSKGIWLKLAKQDSGIRSVSKTEAIDGALCHGWIDGQLQKYDENCWLIRFTPRGARSKWSKLNQGRAQALMDQGRMSAAGLEEVSRAKADGRWEAAYAPQSTAEVPADLQAALNKNAKARRMFSELDRVNRYAILYRVHDARKPETRAARIDKFVKMLARGETIHRMKKKKSAAI
jgi:uncharacterized protein YdeI (YjbR/CyaY-like superfamily)